MTSSTPNENISFLLKDEQMQNNERELMYLLKKFSEMDTVNTSYNNDLNNSYNEYYHEKYTIPQLLRICEYYGFLKYVKSAKYKKNEIIDTILSFELNDQNSEIVMKRQQLWTIVEELSNDKFMKKYIIWN